jgi:membrane protein
MGGVAVEAATHPAGPRVRWQATEEIAAMTNDDERRSAPGAPPGPDDPAAPDGPTELPRRSWRDVLRRTAQQFREDRLTDQAAALTYYAVLSIFPALLAVISVFGLLGQDATGPMMENFGALAPGPARETVQTVLQTLAANAGAAGITAIISIAVALWSASGYVAAFMRVSNVVYKMPEGRPIWKKLPLRVAITAVLLVAMSVGVIAVVFTGGLAAQAGDALGVGPVAVTVWDIAKWPVLVIIVALVLAVLYWAAPNVRQPGFRWLTPGSLLAVVLWIVASVAFAVYVATFGAYSRTYAALAGVIVFLIWLWLSNIAVLFGLELDAELARERAIAAGHPPEQEPYMEPRDTRKIEDWPRDPD